MVFAGKTEEMIFKFELMEILWDSSYFVVSPHFCYQGSTESVRSLMDLEIY